MRPEDVNNLVTEPIVFSESWDADQTGDAPMPTDGRVSEDFQKAWKDECVKKSVISESLYNVAIDFVRDQPLYESLKRDIPKQAGFGGLRSHDEGARFINEDGTVFQVKLDVPRMSPIKNAHGVTTGYKPIKYECAKGAGAQVYTPAIDVETRRKIGKRYGVSVPETGCFWTWLKTDRIGKTLKIIITEGGKKTLSLLSCGSIAVGVMGVNAVWKDSQTALLLDAIRDLVSGGRPVTIAFDQDTKAATKTRVDIATRDLGRALGFFGGQTTVAEWDSASGKGVDDFIYRRGVKAWIAVEDAAVMFSFWTKERAIARAHNMLQNVAMLAKATNTSKAKTVTDARFDRPQWGYVVFLDSAMGLGKTHYLIQLFDDLLKEDPDLAIDLMMHRNMLSAQSVKRLRREDAHGVVQGIDFHQLIDLTASPYGQALVENTQHCSYCIDSLHRRIKALLTRAKEGKRFVLGIDEVNATINQLHRSPLIKNRKALIENFRLLIEAVNSGMGMIVGAEDMITNATVQFFAENGAKNIIVNRLLTKPKRWKVNIVGGVKSKTRGGEKKRANGRETTLALVEKFVNQNKKVALFVTSQALGEQIDHILTSQGIKTFRIDSKTVRTPGMEQIIGDINTFIPKNDAQVYIMSPTVESGLSIEGEGIFDEIVLYGHGMLTTCFQMAGRVRDAGVTRWLVLAEQAFYDQECEFSPDKIERENLMRLTKTLELADLQLIDNNATKMYRRTFARLVAIERAGDGCLQRAIMNRLNERGAKVSKFDFPVTGDQETRIREAKETIEAAQVEMWLDAVDSGITKEAAEAALNGTTVLSEEDEKKYRKAIERCTHGVKVDDPEWVATFHGNKSKGHKTKTRLKSRYSQQNPGKSIDVNKASVARTIAYTGAVLGDGKVAQALVDETLAKLPMQPVLDLINAGTRINADTPQVIALCAAAVAIGDECKLYLKRSITKKTPRMTFVNGVLDKFYALKSKETKEGPKGGQIRFYTYSIDDLLEKTVADFAPTDEQLAMPDPNDEHLFRGKTVVWNNVEITIVEVRAVSVTVVTGRDVKLEDSWDMSITELDEGVLFSQTPTDDSSEDDEAETVFEFEYAA